MAIQGGAMLGDQLWGFISLEGTLLWGAYASWVIAVTLVFYSPEIRALFDPVEREMKKLKAWHEKREEQAMREYIRNSLKDPAVHSMRLWNGTLLPDYTPRPSVSVRLITWIKHMLRWPHQRP